MKDYSFIGNKDILKNHKLAFFCSKKCPPDIIIKCYDKAKEWKEKSVCVISGFHSLIEKDVLNYLLKGEQPIIICPARSLINYRIDSNIKKESVNGRVLIMSNLNNKRISKKYSHLRNLHIADIADEIFVGNATKGGSTEKIFEYAKTLNKKVYTFDN
jgi:predicted Rossmann fold nucleotide-binding protein DprA/Smf involved in DNA uptake